MRRIIAPAQIVMRGLQCFANVGGCFGNARHGANFFDLERRKFHCKFFRAADFFIGNASLLICRHAIHLNAVGERRDAIRFIAAHFYVIAVRVKYHNRAAELQKFFENHADGVRLARARLRNHCHVATQAVRVEQNIYIVAIDERTDINTAFDILREKAFQQIIGRLRDRVAGHRRVTRIAHRLAVEIAQHLRGANDDGLRR